MKVIGMAAEKSWRKQYIAIVDHDELERVSDKRYGESKLKELKPGDEFDLGSGANFRDEIKQACKDMVDAMKSFENARATMMRFAVMIAATEQPASDSVVEQAAA